MLDNAKDVDNSGKSRVTKLYLAGPISNKEDFNYPKFMQYAAELRKRNYEVLNPAERNDIVPPGQRPWRWYMMNGIRLLLEADAVALMSDWKDSRGARLEVTIADGLDMPVFVINDNTFSLEQTAYGFQGIANI